MNPGFAWNHGDVQDEIGNTWFGMVGPGIDNNGVDTKTWTDHVDLRATMNTLLGLRDNYVDDGRVVTQIVDSKALPNELRAGNVAQQLGDEYKQINAPFGQFATDTLVASTAALASTDPLKYDQIEASIANLTTQRNALAGDIRQALNDAAGGVDAARREPGEHLDHAGAEPAQRGPRPRGREPRAGALIERRRSTSEASSSRHAPGSRPSSVNGP